MANITDFIISVKTKGVENVKKVKQEVDKLATANNNVATASVKAAAAVDKVVDKSAANATKKVGALNKAAEGTKKSYEKVGKAIGVMTALVTSGLAAYALKLANNADAMINAAEKMNTTIGNFQAFSDVAATMGINAEGAADQIAKFNAKLVEAGQTGKGEVIDTLSRMGLTLKDLEGLTTDEKLAKISAELNKFGKDDQTFLLDKFKLDGLSPLIKGYEAVGERQDYLRKNGLILSKEQIQGIADVTAKLSMLMSDINTFSTTILADVYNSFDKIFNLDPDDGKNKLLNKENADMISKFLTRIVIIGKLVFESMLLAGKGIGAFIDKVIYMVENSKLYLELFSEMIDNTDRKIMAIIDNFTFDYIVDGAKEGFMRLVWLISEKTGEIEKIIGNILGNKSLVLDGMARIKQAAEETAKIDAERAAKYPELNNAMLKSDEEYEKKKAELKVRLDALNATNDANTIKNSASINETTKEMGKLYDYLLYPKKAGLEVAKKETDEGKKQLKNLEDMEKIAKGNVTIEKLKAELLASQGKYIEANEIQRKIALEQTEKDFEGLASKGEALDLTNKIFDMGNFKVQYDEVSQDIERLKEKLANTSALSPDYESLQERIKTQTELQIDLEGKLGIKRKEIYQEQFLSQKQLIDMNKQFADGLSNGLVDFAKGTKTAKDAAMDFLMSMIDMLMKAIAQQIVLNGLMKAFGGGAATGESGAISALVGAGKAYFGGGAGAATAAVSASSTFHNGGKIEQTDLIKPSNMDFRHDEGLIKVKAGESVDNNTTMNNYGGGETNITNNITLGTEEVATKVVRSQSFDNEMKQWVKRNGPLIKNNII